MTFVLFSWSRNTLGYTILRLHTEMARGCGYASICNRAVKSCTPLIFLWVLKHKCSSSPSPSLHCHYGCFVSFIHMLVIWNTVLWQSQQLLELDLFLWAVSHLMQGDWARLLRCWKFLLLHLQHNGRTKYSSPDLCSTFTPQGTPRWYGIVHATREGNNFPLDLQNEFLNSVSFFHPIVVLAPVPLNVYMRILTAWFHWDKDQHIPPYTTKDFHLMYCRIKWVFVCC